VWDQLRTVYDPEIPVNIVDLGLVYDLHIVPPGRVEVKMTLTAPGCGMGGAIAADAQGKIASVPGVADAEVQVVWDPPWSAEMMTPEGKRILGIS
jgi:metal-sulfur cluster biosynthetic enzyme